MQEKELRDIIDPENKFEVETEEQAEEYLKFLQSKLDAVTEYNDDLLKQRVADMDRQMGEAPRRFRRKFQKEKFSDKFKKAINSK